MILGQLRMGARQAKNAPLLEDTHIGAIKQPRIKRDFCRDFYYHMEIPETYLNIIYA